MDTALVDGSRISCTRPCMCVVFFLDFHASFFSLIFMIPLVLFSSTVRLESAVT